MTEITPYADEADERRGLDISNAVWPHDRIGIDEARSFRSSLLDHVDLLARIDGEVGGSAIGAIEPSWPEVVSALVTVLPEQRHRGAGTGLYEVISTWARARDLDTIETVVADNDPESLAFAQRRGFAVDRREKGLSLDLTRTESARREIAAGRRDRSVGRTARAGPRDVRGRARGSARHPRG